MKKLIASVLSLCLILLSASFLNCFAYRKTKVEQNTLEEIQMSDTEQIIKTYQEATDHDLAVLISNHDLSNQTMEKILQSHGYRDYLAGCETLTRKGYLVYIPVFEITGVRQGGVYTTPNTLLAHNAKERGII